MTISNWKWSRTANAIASRVEMVAGGKEGDLEQHKGPEEGEQPYPD